MQKTTRRAWTHTGTFACALAVMALPAASVVGQEADQAHARDQLGPRGLEREP
jgi:hypothetical protein